MNGWIPGGDAAAIYGLIALHRPATYLEVGSGWSTRFARRAVSDHDLPTKIVAIDPMPRAEIAGIADEIVRQPVEAVDLSVLDRLQSGDVMFVDNSHRVFTNSDATTMLLDALPRLPRDVVVGFHDIYLPDDYPATWNDRFYSEQYLLAGLLLGGDRVITTELPLWYVCIEPELRGRLNPVWDRIGDDTVERHGNAYWVRTTGGAGHG